MKIEGKNAVYEALKSNATFDKILVEKSINHEIISTARKLGIKVQFVDRNVLDKQSTTGKHQGFIAYVSEYKYFDIEQILDTSNGRHFIVLLDGIEDPHNLGSIIRVCECAGVDGIVLPKNRSVSVNDTVVKVSAGASAHVKVARVVNLNSAIETIKQRNIFVYCADMDGQSMYETDLSGDVALVIGGEGKGVSSLTKKLCDGVISIPLLGKVNSLNASVACGLTVYEAVRQLLNK